MTSRVAFKWICVLRNDRKLRLVDALVTIICRSADFKHASRWAPALWEVNRHASFKAWPAAAAAVKTVPINSHPVLLSSSMINESFAIPELLLIVSLFSSASHIASSDAVTSHGWTMIRQRSLAEQLQPKFKISSCFEIDVSCWCSANCCCVESSVLAAGGRCSPVSMLSLNGWILFELHIDDCGLRTPLVAQLGIGAFFLLSERKSLVLSLVHVIVCKPRFGEISQLQTTFNWQ